MFNEINRTNLNQQIVSQILNRILNGSLAPGDKLLPERELAEQFQINRNTLREALRQIELLGLLNIRQGNGIYIKDFRECGNLELIKHMLYTDEYSKIKTIKSILEIRNIIIPEMVAKATLIIEKHQLKKMKKVIFDKHTPTLKKDLIIHQIIAKSSDNILYIFILNFFNQIFQDFGRIYFESDENRKTSEAFHKEILKALTESDPDKCKEITANVLEYARNQIIEKMENQK